MPPVRAEVVAAELGKGIPSVDATVLTLPGDVKQALYDPDSRMLFASFALPEAPGRRGEPETGYLSYGLEESRVRWAGTGNVAIEHFREGVAVVSFGDKRRICDASSGELIRRAERGLVFVDPEGITLSLRRGRSARIDLVSGEEAWKRQDGTLPLWTERDGDWMQTVSSNAFHVFRFVDGEGWDRSVPTCNSGAALAKHMAKGVAVGVLTTFLSAGMVTVVPGSSTPVTHSFSMPLRYDERVYFAGRDKLYCFGGVDGEFLWETRMEEEIGMMDLHGSENGILLMGLGYRYAMRGAVPAERPRIILFSPDSGDSIAYAELPGDSEVPVLDSRLTEHGYLMLTPDRIYVFGDDLSLTGTIDGGFPHGKFLRFLDGGESILVRTSAGVFAATLTPPGIRDFQRVGRLDWLHRPWNCSNAIQNRDEDELRSLAAGGGLWLEGAGKLQYVSFEDDLEITATLPLDYDTWELSRQTLVGIKGTTVTVIPLAPQARGSAN